MLMKAVQGWDSFDGRYLRSWLIRLLRNEFIDELRRRKVRPQTEFLESDEGAWASEAPIDVTRLSMQEILAAVDRLPEEYRTVLSLADIEELSYEEISDALELPLGTVRSRLFRARRLMRRALPHYG